MCSVDGISVPFPERNKATNCYLRKYFILPELESLSVTTLLWGHGVDMAYRIMFWYLLLLKDFLIFRS